MPIYRGDEPKLRLEKMVAFKARCKTCQKGIVMIRRDTKTFKVMPADCQCLLCGQRYVIEIADLDSWQQEQWEQKDRGDEFD